MKSIIALIGIVFAAAFWWLLLDSRAPSSADDVFDIAAYRALIADDDELPSDVRVEIVGSDEAPGFAVETGGGFSKHALYYTALQIISPSQITVIGGAVDDLTATAISQSETANFDADAYERLKASYANAEQIFITHEHLDHVMAITRHPAPETFADKLRLTAPQIQSLPRYAPAGGLSPALASLMAFEIAAPMRVAPGIVVAPAAGHSPGSLVFFVRRDNGQEYLFIGDIVWAMSNIRHLKTRPRLLQYLFFEPDEDRKEVLRQVRALHDISIREPDLIIVPDHDGAHLQQLINQEALGEAFQ